MINVADRASFMRTIVLYLLPHNHVILFIIIVVLLLKEYTTQKPLIRQG